MKIRRRRNVTMKGPGMGWDDRRLAFCWYGDLKNVIVYGQRSPPISAVVPEDSPRNICGPVMGRIIGPGPRWVSAGPGSFAVGLVHLHQPLRFGKGEYLHHLIIYECSFLFLLYIYMNFMI